ncbi:MaoC family dehydratase [Sinomonas humi]|uniref:Enoyl-CoA hydratase n=1 Tax=Sinomonas humi TaxID=1338436 RepID=A0A0B2AHP6_9MICC|nr:MaoC family dehydratase [Sinomonas humi]KHL01351.1 enoyl-CoA hydratase [Sinomonas humi]
MTRRFTSLAELREALGEAIGPSEPLVVTQERIDAFADVTDDYQWIHTDPVQAATGPYGSTIAHGYLTLSLIPQFGRQLFSIEFGSARVNYGVNKVRFPSPTRVNDPLRATVTFADIAETAGGTMLTARYVIDAGSNKPACVAETLVLIAS